VGEVLLNSDADVPSRRPAPFRHVDWRERDIAMVRLAGGTIRTRSRIPLTPSHNEITDKGCIDQFAGPTRRAAVVERLYEDRRKRRDRSALGKSLTERNGEEICRTKSRRWAESITKRMVTC